MIVTMHLAGVSWTNCFLYPCLPQSSESVGAVLNSAGLHEASPVHWEGASCEIFSFNITKDISINGILYLPFLHLIWQKVKYTMGKRLWQ